MVLNLLWLADVILTVPASFGDVARTLTLEAARRVGLHTNLVLLEPQAAFYDYFDNTGSLIDKREDHRVGRRCGQRDPDLTLIDSLAE